MCCSDYGICVVEKNDLLPAIAKVSGPVSVVKVFVYSFAMCKIDCRYAAGQVSIAND